MKNGFVDFSITEINEVNGGWLGVSWLDWALLGKVFAYAVTFGAVGETAYLATK